MFLRSLGYLLTRRFFYPRISRAQAESSPRIVSQAASVSAAGRPARSLYKLRDLVAGDSAYGAVVAAALAGVVGILIFKKHPDDADSNVTDEDTKKEMPGRKPELTDNKPRHYNYLSDMKKQDMEKQDMESRFHEWKKWMGRVYPNQEAAAKRFELFKERAKHMDSLYEGRSSSPYLPNLFADRTSEEIRAMTGRKGPVDQYHDEEYEALYRLIERKQKILKEKMKGNIGNCWKQ